ncbi:MAG: hypothetical protein JXJ22_04155 [Bacteroidales bacterium]|nr:hypothetical protein [Bacteroidales bacterium]
MKRMRKVKTSLNIGVFLIFIVSFAVLMINIGANQRVVNKAQSLLTDNYPSVKYAFEMLTELDELNVQLIYAHQIKIDSTTLQDSGNVDIQIFLEKIKENMALQQQNITEQGEKELTESMQKSLMVYQKSVFQNEFIQNFEAYWTKYQNLRVNILSIHNLNIALLESKNEEIKNSTLQISNTQEKVGIVGLAMLVAFIFVLPMLIINPIDRLTERMINFYKTNFNKEIEIKTNHELEKLEEIFEKIVLETKSGRPESNQK